MHDRCIRLPHCADLLNECSQAVPSTHIIDVVRHPGVTPPIAASSDHIFVYNEASYTCMGFEA